MKNQEVRGDTSPINDKGKSKEGDFAKSLGEASSSDLDKGFYGQTKITSDTKSDNSGFA